MHARALVRSSSAMPPSASIPGNRPAAQCMSSPPRQARHSPQLTSGCRITPSPGATLLTACPTACTQPAFSWPRVYGNPTPDRPAHWPPTMCRSVRHSPAPPTRTITSHGPATVGSGTSSTTGRCSYLCNRTAFTRTRLLGWPQPSPPRASDRRAAGGPAVGTADQRRVRTGLEVGAAALFQVIEHRLPGRERQEGDPLGDPSTQALLVADGERLGLRVGDQPTALVQRPQVADPQPQQLAEVQPAADRGEQHHPFTGIRDRLLR